MNSFKSIKIDLLALYINLDTPLVLHIVSYLGWIAELIGKNQVAQANLYLGEKSETEIRNNLLKGEVPKLLTFSPSLVSKSKIIYLQSLTIGQIHVIFSYDAREKGREVPPW